jgi:hypothetical protein
MAAGFAPDVDQQSRFGWRELLMTALAALM